MRSCSFVSQPDLLVLDEPTNGMDPTLEECDPRPDHPSARGGLDHDRDGEPSSRRRRKHVQTWPWTAMSATARPERS
ncbi:MAG: hypothetical protein MZU97_07100 [Bacillus subtilis]|nr:hypothetical protein [Bacillus subtilis]